MYLKNSGRRARLCLALGLSISRKCDGVAEESEGGGDGIVSPTGLEMEEGSEVWGRSLPRGGGF